jgi:RNA polymerase sigma factor (sigma-70 family)
MDSACETQTRASLLLAVRDYGNAPAWAAFTRRYEGPIRAWCRRMGLRHDDEDDVVQAILVKLVEKIRQFDYDPRKGRFRQWLRRLVHGAVVDRWRRANRHPCDRGRGESWLHEAPEDVPIPAGADPQELLHAMEQQMERDRRVHAACERVRRRVEDQTWQAFWLTTVEGCKGTEVKDRLGMTVAAVYVAKSRVLKMIRNEIGCPPAGP